MARRALSHYAGALQNHDQRHQHAKRLNDPLDGEVLYGQEVNQVDGERQNHEHDNEKDDDRHGPPCGILQLKFVTCSAIFVQEVHEEDRNTQSLRKREHFELCVGVHDSLS
jgi:hypothetical protein